MLFSLFRSIRKGQCCSKILELIWEIRKSNRHVLPKVEDSELPPDMCASEYKKQYKALMSIDKYLKLAAPK